MHSRPHLFKYSVHISLIILLAACGQPSQVVQAPPVDPQAQAEAPATGEFNTLALSNNTVYTVSNACSNKVLEVASASAALAANVVVWAPNAGNHQKWKLISTSSGYYNLIAQHSGQALDVKSSQISNGTTVQQFYRNTSSAQQWKPVDVGNGKYQLVSRLSNNKALDVSGSGSANGTKVQLFDKNASCAQQWTFKALGGGGNPPVTPPIPNPPPTNPPPTNPPTNDPAFDAKCTPTVTLGQGSGAKYPNDPDPLRQRLFLDVSGSNPEAFMQDIGRKVCRTLYRKASEIRDASRIKLVLSNAVGEVAFKSGNGADITVMISTDHLSSVKKAGRDVGKEIKGILFHEMTHMYQQDDGDKGGADGGLIEGIADTVRFRAGFIPDGAQPNKNGRWNDGYRTTAFFLLWVDQRYPNFIYKLNLSMDDQDNIKWTPNTFSTITGKTVDQLWSEYKASPN